FVVRLAKFAGGAAELLRQHFPAFLVSRAMVTEKVDAALLLGTYALMPLVLGNLLLSAYLCHVLWDDGASVLSPRLPYLFLGMFLLSLAILISVHRAPLHALRHWFWGVAVYGAAMPMAAGHFRLYLFRTPPYRRT